MANNDPLNSLERRVTNELYLLYKQFGNASILRDKNDDAVITILHNNKSYSITVDSSYPFKPPIKMVVNQTSIKNPCKLNGTIFSNYLQEYYGASCLCHGSILFNHSKWSPALKITHIIDEIVRVDLVKKKILMRILCNGIRNKYGCLIEFARFEDYLFP